MSEQTSQEPTMEEILASIRRIISEDDAPAADPAETPPAATEEPAALEAEPEAAPEPVAEEPEPAPPAPEPEPVEAAAESGAESDDDLELTDKVETHGDLDVYTPSAPAPAPEPVPMAAAVTKAVEPLVGERASASASAAFGQLSAAILMPAEGRTLEDVVRELLRPLLQQWLDSNLPTIVQQAVETEVERIARGRGR
jgi:cell pole-organizing protein PopZ